MRRQVRVEAGKEPEPSAGSIDSQSVKATRTGSTRGYDAGKKINGIKRHLLVGALGLVLAAVVHSAGIQDRDGAKLVFAKAKLRGEWPRMARVWADGGYAGKLIAWVATAYRWLLKIVKRNDDVKGFKLLPKRWVVERTFSWLSNYRRLSKHYEYWDETGEAMRVAPRRAYSCSAYRRARVRREGGRRTGGWFQPTKGPRTMDAPGERVPKQLHPLATGPFVRPTALA